MKKIVKLLASALIAGLAFSSCTVKDDIENTGSGGSSGGGGTTGTLVQVSLTSSDPNINYRRVTVQILSVLVNPTDDPATGWVGLGTTAGMYDLVSLLNGQTLLASGRVNASAIKQIRLVLGSDNSVDIGNLSYPLSIPAGTDARVTLNKDLGASTANLLIDFAINASIHQQADGTYTLTPVLSIRTP
jgi:hypothetical protein